MLEERLVDRIQELIALSEGLRQGKPNYGTLKSEQQRAECSAWLGAAYNAICQACALPGHPYRKTYDDIRSGPLPGAVHVHVGAVGEMLKNILEDVRPYLEELAGMANVTVALGTRDRLSVVYLDVCRGSQIITLSRNAGSRLPIATSAMGRAIMAALPEGERDYLLRALRERDPENHRKVEKGVRDACDEIAEHGFCTSFGDWLPDVNAVAAPLVSLDGEHLYGINAGGPSFIVSREVLMNELGPRLARIARDLSGPSLTHRASGGK